MEKILISACLVGENTTYKKTNNYTKDIELLKKHFELVLICPEVMGGLTIPRNPSEIKPCESGKISTRVFDNLGKDVTDNFNLGANKVLTAKRYWNIKLAVLKDESPSCGVHQIHNGYFLNVLKSGQGITTRLLKSKGVKVYSEKEIEQLLIDRGFKINKVEAKNN